LKGIAASIGVAVAPARVVGPRNRQISYEKVDEGAVAKELERFEDAVAKSRAELEAAKEELTLRHGPTYAPILDVHLLMHGDALLVDAVADAIRNDRITAEWAVARVTERLRAPLLGDASIYFRERAQDIAHVEEHLLRHLCGEGVAERDSEEPSVLITHDLTPADAVRMLAPPTAGLVTEAGAGSSHTAILARTFGVPAVVGVGPQALQIADGEEVLVDGFAAEVRVGVSAKERRQAEARRSRYVAFLEGERSGGATTKDGVAVTVASNLELPTDVEAALESGSEGIGLYRTEFMCLDRDEPPSEAQQFEVYRSIVTAMAPNRVVFRTFDWRGDKRIRANDLGKQQRGWLKSQIKAVLRASVAGAASLMFPMIATIEELRAAQELVAESRADLVDAGAHPPPVPVGMMVEVPSAALLADQFAEHVDFFSVGTNDLAHYTMALDRSDGAASASPLHPAVLRLIVGTVAAADRAGIPCSLCGDMAADPVALGLALGLGFRSVSVPVSMVGLARAVIGKVDLAHARSVAEEALWCTSVQEVRKLVEQQLAKDLDPLWKPNGR